MIRDMLHSIAVSRLMVVKSALVLAGCFATSGASADDLDRAKPYRAEINGAIDILVASKVNPSQSCVSALDEMHTTDGQLKDLSSNLDEGTPSSQEQQSQQSEVGIARDVLATDLQSAVSACRPDAVEVCASATTTTVARLCEVFRRDMAAAEAKRQ